MQLSAAGWHLAGETARFPETVRACEEGVVCGECTFGGTSAADRAFRQRGLIAFPGTEGFAVGSQVASFDSSGADGTFRQGLFQTLIRAGT